MQRLPRRYWHDHRSLIVLLLCALALWWRVDSVQEATPPSPDTLDEGVHQVRRVIDGDTLRLASGARLRLQGIDTPESVAENRPIEPWGHEASEFTKDFIERAHHRVRLTFSLERKDRHGRFLAFVWNGKEMLNEELVRAGLAHARMDYRYDGSMKRRLAAAQDEARKAKRGIWSGHDPASFSR